MIGCTSNNLLVTFMFHSPCKMSSRYTEMLYLSYPGQPWPKHQPVHCPVFQYGWAPSKKQCPCAQTSSDTYAKYWKQLHLSFIYLMCGIKLSLLAKKRPRNLHFSSTGSCFPYSLRLGSGCKPFLLQKCTHKVFVGEKAVLIRTSHQLIEAALQAPLDYCHIAGLAVNSQITNRDEYKRNKLNNID